MMIEKPFLNPSNKVLGAKDGKVCEMVKLSLFYCGWGNASVRVHVSVIYIIHSVVNEIKHNGVNEYPHVVHNLWRTETGENDTHMLKHKHNIKKIPDVQRFFVSYPQYLPLVDGNCPHHYIL
ncbi:hypothetical protein [Lentibacillus juripiscarius]|uniref:hypothetical protein n=1 Tax=Lentibacillus juripiscarius TaxID=257446 RepID=UPI0036D3B41E